MQENKVAARLRPFLCATEGLVRKMDPMTVSARTQGRTCVILFCLCVSKKVFHHMQAPGQLNGLAFSCVCTELDIVNLPELVN